MLLRLFSILFFGTMASATAGTVGKWNSSEVNGFTRYWTTNSGGANFIVWCHPERSINGTVLHIEIQGGTPAPNSRLKIILDKEILQLPVNSEGYIDSSCATCADSFDYVWHRLRTASTMAVKFQDDRYAGFSLNGAEEVLPAPSCPTDWQKKNPNWQLKKRRHNLNDALFCDKATLRLLAKLAAEFPDNRSQHARFCVFRFFRYACDNRTADICACKTRRENNDMFWCPAIRPKTWLSCFHNRTIHILQICFKFVLLRPRASSVQAIRKNKRRAQMLCRVWMPATNAAYLPVERMGLNTKESKQWLFSYIPQCKSQSDLERNIVVFFPGHFCLF